jgi:hypothetical protein
VYQDRDKEIYYLEDPQFWSRPRIRKQQITLTKGVSFIVLIFKVGAKEQFNSEGS